MKVTSLIAALAVVSQRANSSPTTSSPAVQTYGAGTPVPGPVLSYGSYVKPPSLPTIAPFQPGRGSPGKSTGSDANSNYWLPNSPTHRGNWWGQQYNINTDQSRSWPNTGQVCAYDFTMTNTTLAPDGTPKQMLVVNGQYPGPTVECNWGDIVQVTVHNHMADNGTGIHWHGFRQSGTNDEDGVPGVTECPLAPGDSKVYRFQATSYGTTWYHSHFSLQYGDGVLGPVVIHGPASANYDIDLGPVTLSETYPLTAFQEDWFADRQGPPQASNVLFNGKNIKPDGSAGTRQIFSFTPGKKHLIRLINTSVDTHYSVQIDNHNLTVIANDFVPINPYNTSSLSIGIGQRYDVIVDANQNVASYWFRAIPHQGPPASGPPTGPPTGPPVGCCSNLNTGLGVANAIIKYNGATAALPTTNPTTFTPDCLDEPAASLVPVVTKTVDSTAFVASASALPVNIGRVNEAGEGTLFSWVLNGISLNIDWDSPTLAQAVTGNDTFVAERNVVTLPTANVWTFWVIQNQFFVPHPMHLHGHDFSLLGQGVGTFDAASMMSQLNFANPTRRDVAMLPAQGWTVIAFQTDNPGAWLMHCHIAWHVGEGLALQFLEVPSQIPAKYTGAVSTNQFKEVCGEWSNYWAGSHPYSKTDSGLRKRDEMAENGLYAPARAGAMDVKRHVREHVRRSANQKAHF